MSLFAVIRRALFVCVVAASVCAVAAPADAQSKSKKKSSPETFHARAKVMMTGVAGADALVTIQIDKYTPEK